MATNVEVRPNYVCICQNKAVLAIFNIWKPSFIFKKTKLDIIFRHTLNKKGDVPFIRLEPFNCDDTHF